MFLAVKKWRSYLDGHKCKVITDHRPLEHIQTQPHVTRRQARWMEWLGEFALNWEYRPGKEGVAPDALSRIMTMVVCPVGSRGFIGRRLPPMRRCLGYAPRQARSMVFSGWLIKRVYSCFIDVPVQVISKGSW